MENRYVEETLKSLGKRVEILENDRKELNKLSTLMEIQIEMNKEQDAFLREQSTTLVKMNENLTSLNTTTTKLDNRIETLETKFTEERLNNLSQDVESEKSNSINIPQLIQQTLFSLLSAGIISGVIYIISIMN